MNNSPKNCIICLDECKNNNYIKYPTKQIDCECKYNVHQKCDEQCNEKWNKDECLICHKKIELIIENNQVDQNDQDDQDDQDDQIATNNCPKCEILCNEHSYKIICIFIILFLVVGVVIGGTIVVMLTILR